MNTLIGACLVLIVFALWEIERKLDNITKEDEK